MEVHKINVTLYADAPYLRDSDALAPILQRWIQERVLSDHLLIDVARYGHVTDGPGTLLVAREANISARIADGKLTLTYARRTPAAGEFVQRVTQALSAARECAHRLGVKPQNFVLVQLNDRLLAPNDATTLEAAAGPIRAAVEEVYGPVTESLPSGDEHDLFGLRLSFTPRA